MSVSSKRLRSYGYISHGCWLTEADAEFFAEGLRASGCKDVAIKGPNQYRRGFEVFSLDPEDDDFYDGWSPWS